MINIEEASQKEQKMYTVIFYEDNVVFNYTLPDEEESQSIERELTFIWEESVEKFIEEFGVDRPYSIRSFKQKRAQEIFIEQVEGRTDELLEEVEEDIANKMKYGFEFTGQLHNDD